MKQKQSIDQIAFIAERTAHRHRRGRPDGRRRVAPAPRPPGAAFALARLASRAIVIGVELGQLTLLDIDALGLERLDRVDWAAAAENLLDRRLVVRAGRVRRKIDLDAQQQVAALSGRLVVRHALVAHDEQLARSQHAARRHSDAQLAVVERLEAQHGARERLDERHAHRRLEVVAVALKVGVRTRLEHDDNVARLDAGRLVGLARERDLLARLHALVNVDVEQRLLLEHFVAVAGDAHILLVHLDAGALALGARTLHALQKARSDLLRGNDNTVTAARGAARRLSAALGAVALARGAEAVAAHGELALRALVEVLEVDGELERNVVATLRATRTTAATAATKERLEQTTTGRRH
jgi:hypothetical protein